MGKTMNLEAVTVCVGYADFLAVTLPRNLPLFDRWVIVTSPDDHETRELCRRHGITPILTQEFYRDGAEFAKARGINKGIDALGESGWRVHLDADVILPPGFRQAVADADPDPDALYGCDRVMVRSWRDWCRLRDSGYLQRDYHCRVNFPAGLTVGTRWANHQHGYCPIGFFQMWNGSADLYRGAHTRPYPTAHNDAARADVQFAIQWDRRHRHLLPEVVAIHLESEPAPLGANWKGRTTRRFGPNGRDQ
jgi:hypothetical protein